MVFKPLDVDEEQNGFQVQQVYLLYLCSLNLIDIHHRLSLFLSIFYFRHKVEEEKETWKTIGRAAFAEFIGSALFVFIACGAATTTANYTSPVRFQ